MWIADKQYCVIWGSEELDQIYATAAVDEQKNVAVAFVVVESSLEIFHAHPEKIVES